MAYQSRDFKRPRFNNNRRDDDRRPGRREDERPARYDRKDRPERPARFDREDRPGRFERSDRPERPARFDRNDRPERPARFDRNDRPERKERPARFDREDRPGRFERSDRPERPVRFDRNDRPERPARFDRNDRPERKDRPARLVPPPAAPEAEAPSYRDFEYQPPQPRLSFRPAVELRNEARSPRPPRPGFEAPEVPENLLAGRNPIREALRSGRDIERLLVQRGELSGSAREIVQMAREAHVIVQEVDKARLDAIAPHHQGLLAFASSYAYSTVEAMLERAEAMNEPPFLILLDGITDPHNLGAIIRTASCAGAHGVIVPERRSVGLTPAAVKASAGAVEHLPVAKVTNLTRTIEELKAKGIWAYAVTMQGEDYRKVDFAGGVALVIGSEGEGISRLTLEACDRKVSLPLKGEIDSLNASVAAGIMMYRVMEGRA